MHGRGALRVGLDRGIVSHSPNHRPLHDELVERERISLFSRLLLSTLIDLVRCGLGPSLVWCLLFLDSIPLIPDDAMSSGSKECESCSLFWFVVRCFFCCPFSSLSVPPFLDSHQLMASGLSLAAPFGSRQSK